MKLLTIRFWIKDSGNGMSHKEGLSQQQIDELRQLEPGDRLILWKNKREKDSDSHFNLRVYNKKEE